MKTWIPVVGAVLIDLAVIGAATFLAYCKIISGDAVLVVLGAMGGAIGARRLTAKKGQSIPPGVIMGLITGLPPDNGEGKGS